MPPGPILTDAPRFRRHPGGPTIEPMSKRERQRRVVAIETSGRQGSVLVAVDGGVLGSTQFEADLQHASQLLPAIDRLCETVAWRPGQIDEVYVSAGPGSFTGCRIGVTVARALAQAVGVRLVRVPTMAALARNALRHDPRPGDLVVLLDAQRRQVYATHFRLDGDEYVQQGELRWGDPEDLLPELPYSCAALGEGIAYHRRTVEHAGLSILPEPYWPAHAEEVLHVGLALARLGVYTPANEIVPIYVRLPEAEERWRQRHDSPRG